MASSGKKWTAEEVAILVDKVRGAHWREAVEIYLPGRSLYAVECKLAAIGLHGPTRKAGAKQAKRAEDYSPNEWQDKAFQRVMLAAIQAGLENAPIGIVTTPDNADYRPVNYPRGSTGSYCGSAALACIAN